MFLTSKDKYYIYQDNQLEDILCGFGTKQLGDGRDKKLLQEYFNNQILVTPKQSHSTTIVEYKFGDNIAPDHCDGVVTKEKNVVLSVITADCLPIIFYDERAGSIGISHQGWKGTLNRLPSLMIDKMIELGSSSKNIQCIFGPAINDCCYEIYGDRLRDFQKEFKTDFIFRKEKGNYFLNLYKANYLSLQKSGIPPQNIHYFPFCTSCDSKRFYSYKRDKTLLGEMISFILMK